MSISKVVKKIKKFNSFLITTHITPDPDALGSAFGLWYLLKKLNKKAEIVIVDPIPKNYLFLLKDLDLKVHCRFPLDNFECLIAVDASDLERLGKIKETPADIFIINIDHHISNRNFGHINWVEPKSSSCCEMIYKLYRRLNVVLDRTSALLLYSGLIFDTGFFRYNNTSSFTHKLASKFLEYNLETDKLYRIFFGNFDKKEIEFLVKGLSKIKITNRIAYVVIRKNLYRRLSLNAMDYILDFMRNIKDVEVVAIFKPSLNKKGEIRVNLRSQGKIDVNRIAQNFGGGGHPSASGFSLNLSTKKATKIVLKKIKEAFKNESIMGF
ncbi:MAG: bifunctional oligoribonuclease/PAP phosphatase NrnA [Candidatus Omnitrophica bacterium]|nr:bifunctional oligoribonuclease/PAP phosphatase NrnA [Candidatus Omnitrophota bacterium]